jgi:hypothetical protein
MPDATTDIRESVISEATPLRRDVRRGMGRRHGAGGVGRLPDAGLLLTDINLGIFTAKLDLKCIDATSEDL